MKRLSIGMRLKAWARGLKTTDDDAIAVRFAPPAMPAGVIPASEKLAMDEGMASVYQYANTLAGCHESFPGYPLLAQLTQQAEYRMLSEKTAMAMIRKWIKLRSKSDGDKSDKIATIDAKLEELNVRALFGEAAKLDGFFGRSQIFVDLGEFEGPGLQRPMFMDGSVMRGKLRRFTIVEPMWTYPNVYSASNPLAPNYYKPDSWFVMGQKVHDSRLMTFVGRPLPDMLKPAYNFGGMSMTQLARTYVENWLKTRDSVNKIISNFSTSGVKTNLDTLLQGDEDEGILDRAELFSAMRDNQGLMLLDMEREEFFQVNTPLSTLDQLQAQAQEHMASVASMPLPILLGITPAGLNASAEGDIRIFYDHVNDMQRALFGPNLTRVIQIIQLSEFGEIDPDIVYDFVSLWDQDEGELAANRKADAEASAILVEIGAVLPEEVRERLARDEHSGFNGLDLGIKIEAPEEEDDEASSADE